MSKPTPEDAEAMGKAILDLSWKKPPRESEIHDLIRDGADLNARDELGRCALSLAIGAHNEGVARLLLAAGADPNNADSFGRGPLYWAVGASVTPLIPELLNKGARIDAQDNDGYTPLMDASVSGKSLIAKMLIDRGAKLDLVSKYGHSALTLACLNVQKDVDNGHADIIRLLVDAGADATLKNRDGKACTDFLRERGHSELLAYIESTPARREAARPKLVVPKPDKPVKLKPRPPKP